MVICTDMSVIIANSLKRRPKKKKQSHSRLFLSKSPLLEGGEEIFQEGWKIVRGEKILVRFKLGGFLRLRWWIVVEKEHE